MTKRIQERGEDIRRYILERVGKVGLTADVAEHFQISRQAANLHFRNLVSEGVLIADGNTSHRTYRKATTASISFSYRLRLGLEEDKVWRQDVRPFLDVLPQGVFDIWHWAFTEMFNNAIDHSGGKHIYVTVAKSANDTTMAIVDDGIGIFKKIQKALDLPDERQAIFELEKGKFTTDKKNHSGQGIFFTSRMVNNFDIVSGGVYFSHEIGKEYDWMIEQSHTQRGTAVFMRVDNHTARTRRKVLDTFSVGGTLGFNKTIVPVRLARYGTDQLISRSQAKRVLERVELFSQVIFDFSDVETVGQAFADQVFRVFAAAHPEIVLKTRHANKEVLGMINAAIKEGRPGFKGVKRK